MTDPTRAPISAPVPDGYTPFSYPRYGTPTCSGLHQHAPGAPAGAPVTGPARNVRHIRQFECSTHTSWYTSGPLFAYIAPTFSRPRPTAGITCDEFSIYPSANRYLARRSSGIRTLTSANAVGT